MNHLPDSIKTSLQWDDIKTDFMMRPHICLCFTAFLNRHIFLLDLFVFPFFFLSPLPKTVPIYFIYFRWNDPETGMCFLYPWKVVFVIDVLACHMVAEWLQGSSSSLMVPHNPIFRPLYVRPSSWLYCRIYLFIYFCLSITPPPSPPVVFCFPFPRLHLDR